MGGCKERPAWAFVIIVGPLLGWGLGDEDEPDGFRVQLGRGQDAVTVDVFTSQGAVQILVDHGPASLVLPPYNTELSCVGCLTACSCRLDNRPGIGKTC